MLRNDKVLSIKFVDYAKKVEPPEPFGLHPIHECGVPLSRPPAETNTGVTKYGRGAAARETTQTQ